MTLEVVCVVLLLAVAAVVTLGGDDNDNPDAASDRDDALVAEVLSDEELELIHRAEPDPSCASEPAPAPGDEGLVAVGVVRVVGTCLDATTEYVPADQVDTRLAEIDDDPAVVAAAPAPPPPTPGQEDDRREDQWALDMLGAGKSSEMPWPDGTGVVVAVLDSGIAEHEDLGDAVVDRRHYSGEGDLDPDGHGTNVAGIIAARRGNGGIVGVAPAATILDVPVNIEGATQNPDWWVVALPWAVNRGADVANMSFHQSRDDYDEDAYKFTTAVVEFARANDVVMVAGGGNCGGSCPDRGGVPSGLPGVVTVGAVQKDRDLNGESARTDEIDLVAPGGGELLDQIVTTSKDGGYTNDFNGTSAAAPHVAAAAAVLRSAVPQASGDEIAQALIDTADPEGVSEQDRDDAGAGRGLVDIVAALELLRTAHPPDDSDSADRTQAAFVRDDTLVALDGDVAEPVRHLDPGAQVTWLEWSDDHTRLVGLAGTTLFSWTGPGTEPVEVPHQVPCEACGPSLAYLDDISQPEGQGTSDVVVSLHYDGTLTEYDAATLQEMGSTALSFPADAGGTMTVRGAVGGRLVVHETGGAHASERLWLVDPASREAEVSHEVPGGVSGRVVVNAGDDRIAFVDGFGECSSDSHVHVLDGGDLSEIADVTTPSGPDNPTGTMVDELFFNGDALYATMTYLSSGGPGSCEAGSAGIWRLDGDTWDQVGDRPVANARPLEGRSGDEPTGWLTIDTDGHGSVRPLQTDDLTLGDLGKLEPVLWATPTHTEIDFITASPTADGGSGGGGGPPTNDTEAGRAPQTVEAAVSRFEDFVHALGAGDIATACSIGRPAVEAGGLGLTCEQAIPTLREMSSEEELAALRDVDVDPSQVEQTAPDRVEIPPAYPYSTEPETDPPVILEHNGTTWFVTQ